MDGNRFDDLSKRLASGFTRRATVKGAAAAALAALGMRRIGADAQVSVASCGNKTCKGNPGKCTDGCFCCVYSNGNSRCLPPANCSAGSGGVITCPPGQTYYSRAGGCFPTCPAPSEYIPEIGNCGVRCTNAEDCDIIFEGTEYFADCYDGICYYSCFTAGTRVAMADGTSRPIETIRVGDEVLGQNGRINRVTIVETPPLGSRRLYGLNDSQPFVTSEHPFGTEHGWKAIDPSATARENPNIPVSRLKIGDNLLALASVRVLATVGGGGATAAEITLKPVPLTSLIGVPADPNTLLYNLRLDGDHAYFANDLLVHNRG